MDFKRRTAQLLHEDHLATIQVISSLEQLLVDARKKAPDTDDPLVRSVLKLASETIGEEINTHFAFEENELFTRLEDMGDVEIGQHLRLEHKAILPLGKKVAESAAKALESGFSPSEWAEFRIFAGELIERLFTHIQKEEMALLPMLEELISSEDDMEISVNYAGSH